MIAAMVAAAISVLIAVLFVQPVLSQQPRVSTIERLPSRRACGIVSLPEGSPWCNGRPTAFFPGHKDFLEDRPSCLIDGQWTQFNPGKAFLDIVDDLNAIDNPTVTDRHDCGVLDINNDGLLDMYCLVGANVGREVGFNELYLTRKDGSLFKIRRHALQRFNGARTRFTTTLKSVNATELVFISASFGERANDDKINKHAMFRKNGRWTNNWYTRYFDHVRGPWQVHAVTTCAIAIDPNKDGLDDLLLCNARGGEGSLFVQNVDGSFRQNPLKKSDVNQRNWRNARVADFTGDGIDDLAVTYHGTEEGRVRIFRGMTQYPYFDFNNIYYNRRVPFAAPDIEAFDVNGDGVMDLYVVQVDERLRDPNGSPRKENDSYCAGTFNFRDSTWWPVNRTSAQTPPPNWVPPRDIAPDLLLIGNHSATRRRDRFNTVRMQHREPGCGQMVSKFGERSLLLAQGGFIRPGHNIFLEW